MYPSAIDQNRQENLHPQTVHVHMHQFCPCVHPYYAGYRPPLIASPFPVPLPRPYNLQHYQYTQFNLSPYNISVPHTNLISQPQQLPNQHHNSTVDFGPPPRDRRNFDSSEIGVPEEPKENRELFEEFISMSHLNDVVHSAGVPDSANICMSTENFTKFLEQGCILAEKIAIRNQHRPCFKNIQNLCNRTRSEILKPSNTVSNIHSQGIPWATKDFIYAYVRLINCWHMLKGYLDSKDGTLGNIDKELTSDFKTCYLSWEKETKELAAHMIRIFSNLDNNVSNPNPGSSYLIRSKIQGSPSVTNNVQVLPPVIEKESLKTVRGIIHIPSTTPETEVVNLSESTETSPKDDDSDNESRVYMKPGSYSVPKKNNSSNNSSPSIEFFDTAQNVSAHYKKLAKKKQDFLATNDKLWQDAQSAVPYLLNKINPSPAPEPTSTSEELDGDALKYFIDLDTLDQGSDIQEWLNNNNFFENNEINDGSLQSPNHADIFTQTKPVTVLQRSSKLNRFRDSIDFSTDLMKNVKGKLESTSRTYRKRSENSDGLKTLKSFNFKKVSNIWELEKGGLTTNTVILLEKVLKVLEQEKLAKYLVLDKNGKVQYFCFCLLSMYTSANNRKTKTRRTEILLRFRPF